MSAAREVVSVYLADPGARDALRARWPALSLALDHLQAEQRQGALSTTQLRTISNRYRTSPWADPPTTDRRRP